MIFHPRTQRKAITFAMDVHEVTPLERKLSNGVNTDEVKPQGGAESST
jgi:hypothetical protein